MPAILLAVVILWEGAMPAIHLTFVVKIRSARLTRTARSSRAHGSAPPCGGYPEI